LKKNDEGENDGSENRGRVKGVGKRKVKGGVSIWGKERNLKKKRATIKAPNL